MIVQGDLDPSKYNYKCYNDENEEGTYICLGFPKKTKDPQPEKSDQSTKEDQVPDSAPKFIKNRCQQMPWSNDAEFAPFR